MKCGIKAAWHTLFLVTSQTNRCFFPPFGCRGVLQLSSFLWSQIKPVFNCISLEISPTLPPLSTGSTFPPCWKTDSLVENTKKNDEMSLSSACCTSGTVVHPTESYSNRAMRSTIIKQNTWRLVISAVADSYWFVCIWPTRYRHPRVEHNRRVLYHHGTWLLVHDHLLFTMATAATGAITLQRMDVHFPSPYCFYNCSYNCSYHSDSSADWFLCDNVNQPQPIQDGAMKGLWSANWGLWTMKKTWKKMNI